MTIDSIGHTPSPRNGEQEQNQELISRAEELAKKFQEVLKRNNGEYLSTGIVGVRKRLSQEDTEVIEELESFFEDDCRKIASVEVGQGGNYDRDELKKLSDTIWLLREVEAEYDLDEKKYSIIGKEEAKKLLQTIIEEKDRQIKALEAQNQAVKKLLSEIK